MAARKAVKDAYMMTEGKDNSAALRARHSTHSNSRIEHKHAETLFVALCTRTTEVRAPRGDGWSNRKRQDSRVSCVPESGGKSTRAGMAPVRNTWIWVFCLVMYKLSVCGLWSAVQGGRTELPDRATI